MRITMVLPGISTHATGGSKVVFEYANRLASEGFSVEILFLSNPEEGRMAKIPLPLKVKRIINLIRGYMHPKWFKLNRHVKHRTIFDISNQSVPDADWIFATAASTAPGVYKLSSSKGNKGYIIQDYEIWDMTEEELKRTYCYGMKNIVISHWLKDKVDSITGDNCICIPNPVDTTVFFPDNNCRRNPKSVAVLYHPGEHKGFKYAWRAIMLAHERVPDLHVNMFGTYTPPENLPSWVSYIRNADNKELFRIYNSSAVFVCASINEGYGLTCVEAMACGCALVVTDFAGAREYARSGNNAIVVPVGDIEALANGIVRLTKDLNLRSVLADNAINTARTLSWDNAIKQFKQILEI